MSSHTLLLLLFRRPPTSNRSLTRLPYPKFFRCSCSAPTSAAGVTVVVPRVVATEGGVAPLAGAGVGDGAAPGAGDDFGAGVSAGLPNPSGSSDSCAIGGNISAATLAVPDRPSVSGNKIGRQTWRDRV